MRNSNRFPLRKRRRNNTDRSIGAVLSEAEDGVCHSANQIAGVAKWVCRRKSLAFLSPPGIGKPHFARLPRVTGAAK
jgi:hypothetical protein